VMSNGLCDDYPWTRHFLYQDAERTTGSPVLA
jgi:hypothetical protein